MKELAFRMMNDDLNLKTETVVQPVIGSDLVPLQKIRQVRQASLTSFMKKRERRQKHLKEMLTKFVHSDEELHNMMAAILELASNSAEILDKTLIELWKQVNIAIKSRQNAVLL